MEKSKRISSRERTELALRGKLQDIALGDLVSDMIEIGHPDSLFNTGTGRKGKKQRFEFIQEELNRRWDILLTLNDKMGEFGGVLSALVGGMEDKAKKGKTKKDK